MRKLVGFLLGFILSMLITVAVCVNLNLVVTGPVWLLLWGGVGACSSWLFAQLQSHTRRGASSGERPVCIDAQEES